MLFGAGIGYVRSAVDALLALKVSKTGDTMTGDLTVPGIIFDTDTLDDYDEGTWTPTIEGAGTAGTYTLDVTSADYTKIGNTITVSAVIRSITVNAAGTGNLVLGGFPAYPASSNPQGQIQANSGLVFTSGFIPSISLYPTGATIRCTDPSGGAYFTVAVPTVTITDGFWRITASYTTA